MIDRLNAALEGRYRIERELGAGGMATVYLAEDVKHRRKVALKVLKPELAAVVGGDRFLTEIETTANLQHPQILPLYDSGEADTFLFYVMPYVEGESLREKLDRERQLPLDEAVRIAGAVASGLDYAHRQGVVHRDIKPANILLQDGQPVIADFGIALAIQQAGGGRLTETGLSLGTPYYMSPEQATADRDPDARSDVYSLGCVLYEMLTGEPPFTGNTAQSILGKILTAEAVAPTRLRATIPPHVEAATQRALAKLPADRFATAAELARALTDPDAAPMAGGAGNRRASVDADRRGRPWVAWSIAAIAGTGLLWLLAAGGRSGAPSAEAPVIRASLELPDGAAIFGSRVAISADGSTLSVIGTVDGVRTLLARRLDQLEFAPIEGTGGGDGQSLSPDGRSIVFRSGTGMKQAPLSGGQPITLDAEAAWAGADWGPDGTLIYSRSYRSGLFRVRPGGDPEGLTEPSGGELAHWWPQQLPGGEHVLFSAFRTPIEDATLAVLSLETGERREVLKGGVHGRYVPTGHLLFARGEALYAVPFDLDALAVEGEPVVVVDDVSMEHPSGLAAYDISDNGTLVYVPASEADAPSELVWVERDGTESVAVAESERYSNPALSPDGRRLAVSIAARGQSEDVWILDLERGTRSRLGARGGIDFQPVWTPDGTRIIFGSESPVFDLWWRPADGGSPAAPLVVSGYDKYPGTFLSDGTTFLYSVADEPHRQLWRVAVEDGAEPEIVYAPDFDIHEPTVSPTGRWVAYASRDAGPSQVYISSLPDPARVRRQVSAGGGASPRWTRDGRELVYVDGNRFMAVDVDPETGVLGQPRILFQGPYVAARLQDTRNYDATPDGRRFLVVKRPPEQSPRRVVVVTNFHEVLRGMGGTRR